MVRQESNSTVLVGYLVLGSLIAYGSVILGIVYAYRKEICNYLG